MAKIIWTAEAIQWIKDIYDYISLDNPAAAQRVLNGIYKKIQIINDLSEIGFIYRKETEGTIRILLFGHYRITYLIKSDSAVVILGVFHGAMDIDKYFKLPLKREILCPS
jgi:plasmid stabilization system protein ParE